MLSITDLTAIFKNMTINTGGERLSNYRKNINQKHLFSGGHVETNDKLHPICYLVPKNSSKDDYEFQLSSLIWCVILFFLVPNASQQLSLVKLD